MRSLITAAILLLLTTHGARASVVDAAEAERVFMEGNYKAALPMFKEIAGEFHDTSKDSSDYRTYREAAYLFDRLADCCFTQRDWDGLKLYLDGLLVVSVSERNLCESQLAGAIEGNIARATAMSLSERLDMAVRISTIFQLKRSLGLVLYDGKGKGADAEGAIKQYQALVSAMRGVLGVEGGYYVIDMDAIEANVAQFDAIFEALEDLGDIDALWVKYPPEGKPPSAQDEEAEPASG